MIKNITLLALMLSVFTFWGKSLHAQFGGLGEDTIESIDKPVVIELFTSQSCSSCPPADKNLGALSQNPNVIALGFHVTYWNHLHWEDTLSQEFATERQRAYAAHKNNGRVYTPQMIVNGDDEFVGSRSRDIAKSLKTAKDLENILIEDQGKTLKISIPAFAKHTSKATQFWLFGVKKIHAQNIASGENRGRTVTYHNAVLHQKHITRRGKIRDFEIEKPYWPEIDTFVLIAQKDSYGDIIAAGKTP